MKIILHPVLYARGLFKLQSTTLTWFRLRTNVKTFFHSKGKLKETIKERSDSVTQFVPSSCE